MERARLAGEIIQQRLINQFPDLRIDFIGHTSVHFTSLANGYQPYEVRLRIAGKANNANEAATIGKKWKHFTPMARLVAEEFGNM